jgi:hypothetical protein
VEKHLPRQFARAVERNPLQQSVIVVQLHKELADPRLGQDQPRLRHGPTPAAPP